MKKCKKTLRKLHSLEKILDYAQEELKLAEGKGYGSLIKTRQEVMQRKKVLALNLERVMQENYPSLPIILMLF